MRKKIPFPLSLYLFSVTILAVGCSLFRSTLTIDAQIIYNMGGPQPVARQTFYLLDADLLSLKADDPKIKARLDSATDEKDKLSLTMSAMLLAALKNAVENQDMAEKSGKSLLRSVELSKSYWEPHLVQSMQTDFKGHGVFENLKPGNYWLVGMTETRAAFTFWNLKVSLARGENKLMLDQNNALYSK
jgi:hypothetical protein